MIDCLRQRRPFCRLCEGRHVRLTDGGVVKVPGDRVSGGGEDTYRETVSQW